MGWIGVDLDGTLVEYDGWQGELEMGKPIPAMVDRVKEWLAQGNEVRIFTARVCEQTGRDRELVRRFIENWSEQIFGRRLEVTNEKDYNMIELWDDRCVQVEANTGRVLSMEPRSRWTP